MVKYRVIKIMCVLNNRKNAQRIISNQINTVCKIACTVKSQLRKNLNCVTG